MGLFKAPFRGDCTKVCFDDMLVFFNTAICC